MTRSHRPGVTKAIVTLRMILAAALAVAGGGYARAAAQSPTEIRLTPSSFDFNGAGVAGAGTSGLAGIRTIVLKGDPTKPGLYTILLRVPAHTRIAAHRHPDDRIATVVA